MTCKETAHDAVTAQNVRIESFPDVLIARRFGFQAAQPLKFTAEQTSDVDVKLAFGS
jgi:LemA protein